MLLLLILLLLVSNDLVGCRLCLLGPDFFDQFLNASQSFLLLLSAHVQLVDLLNDKLLNLLLHNWRLLLNDLLRFPCLFLDQSAVLPS